MTENPTSPAQTSGPAPIDVGGPVWLDPQQVQFSRSPGGRLRLELPDRCWLHVTAMRAMPLSRGDEFISLHYDEDTEVGMLASLAALAPEQRKLVEDELAAHYYRPNIVGIRRIKDHMGTIDWDVDTDCGHVEFITRHPRHSAQRLGEGHYILTDLDNNRYEITDIEALDHRSRNLVSLLLV